jgi:hypothetical protein
MTEWEKFLERRKKNIGFISKTDAFSEPHPAIKAAALAIEIEKWQNTIGKKPFHVGREYYISKGAGINLLQTRESGYPLKEIKDNAIKAYIETPMDQEGILVSLGIDIDKYKWREIGFFKAILNWLIGRKVRRIK